MDNNLIFREELRYNYPGLNKDSIVFDLGCYEGKFAKTISEKYQCTVYCFEPIKEFYDKIKPNESMVLMNYALGNSNRNELMGKETDKTGLYANGISEQVLISDVADFNRQIDLMKINIEGMEYEVLERMIETEMVKNVKNIQVQFHKIGKDYDSRYMNIRQNLLKTHELTFDFPFMWQNFKLK